MSLGSRSASRFWTLLRAPRSISWSELLSTMTPSTMYNGSEPEMMELVPRSRTETPPPPGLPEFWVIWAPATIPWRAASTVTAGDSATSAPFTTLMLLPSTRVGVGAAAPVTTTASSATATARSVKSATAVCPAATSTVWRAAANPTRRATTSCGPVATAGNRYSPFAPDVTSSDKPVTVIRTSGTGWPVAASVTRPRTTPVSCAETRAGATAKQHSRATQGGRRRMASPGDRTRGAGNPAPRGAVLSRRGRYTFTSITAPRL